MKMTNILDIIKTKGITVMKENSWVFIHAD